MLYIIHGTDRKTARDKIYGLIQALRKKKEQTSYVHIDHEDKQDPLSYAGEQGLFKQKTIVFLDEPHDKKAVEKNLKTYADSQNVFFWYEEKLPKSVKDKAAGLSVTVEEYIAPKTQDRQTHIFTVADSLLKKDDNAVFKAFHNARTLGSSPEEILAIAAWQLRALLLARDTDSPQQAGLSPFPYKKAKQHAGTYEKETLLKALEIASRSIAEAPTKKDADLYAEHTLLTLSGLLK